jgi:hypothetical protein
MDDGTVYEITVCRLSGGGSSPIKDAAAGGIEAAKWDPIQRLLLLLNGRDCWKIDNVCRELSIGVLPSWIGGPLRASGLVSPHGLLRLSQGRIGALEALWSRLRPSSIMTQADGARVYIRALADGRYNVSVWGAEGFVTGFRHMRFQELFAQARRYGWH